MSTRTTFWREVGFACPICRAHCVAAEDALLCAGCGAAFAVVDGVAAMVAPLSDGKAEIERFWSAGAHRRRQRGDPGYTGATAEEVVANCQRVEALYAARGLFSRELPLITLEGRRVLEVGCGSGGASLVMCKYGAEVVAGDLSMVRCRNAARLHALSPWRDRPLVAAQLDAEALPFLDATFDAVLSNGVLHHTPDSVRAVAEVRRVLKPGGVAAVMLYARRSLMYAGLVLYHAVLRGRRWRDPAWLSHVSEQDDAVEGRPNPVTRVFSRAEVRALFRHFAAVEIRQDGLALFSAARFKTLAAVLRPLAPWLGWCLYIRATR